MAHIKICITGNSVALRTRPNLGYPNNRNYTMLLSEALERELPMQNIHVCNKAIGAYTVKNTYQHIDGLIHEFANIYILNIGVVDACTREVPLWFYRIANRKSEDVFSILVRGLYRSTIARLRPGMVILRGKRSWLPAQKFKRYYSLILETLSKETNGRFIILPINIANQRIEKQLPGSIIKQKKLNAIINELAANYNASIVDISDLRSENHYPDGIHYSVEGHRKITDKIKAEVLKMLKL